MGIFKRKAEPKDITKEDTKKFEKDYKDIYEALRGEFGVGSRDTKEAVFYFEDVNYLVRFSEGKIKIVFNIPELDLENRLNYEARPEEFNKLPGSVTAFDIIDGYKEMMDVKNPDVIKGIFRAYSIRRTQELIEKFPKLLRVRSEILSQHSAVEGTKSADFLDCTIDELKSEMERLDKFRAQAETDFGTSFKDLSTIKIKILKNSYIGENAIENFITDMCSGSGTTLSVLKETSDGFIFEEILDTILRLSIRDIIEIDYPGRIDENWSSGGDSLPTFDDPLESIKEKPKFGDNLEDFVELKIISNEQSVDIPENVKMDEILMGEILEPVDDYSESLTHEDSHSSLDDGKFFYEEVIEESSRSTQYASDNIEPDIIRITDGDPIEESKKDELLRKARQNFVLEQELEDIQSLLDIKIKNFEKDLGNFEDLKFNTEIDHVVEDTAISADTETLEKIEETKDATNKNFLEVEQFESDRYLVNSERLPLLERIAVIVSELSHEEVQSVLNRIDLKIKGIKNIENIAFHSPLDSTVESIDPGFLEVPEVMMESDSFAHQVTEEVSEDSLSEVSSIVVDRDETSLKQNILVSVKKTRVVKPHKVLTPAYFEVVEMYGFNPLGS